MVFVASDEKGRRPGVAGVAERHGPRRDGSPRLNAWEAYFGAPGEVVFDAEEKGTLFVYRIKEDGSELQKLLTTPNLFTFGVSPDGRWVATQDAKAWRRVVRVSGWRRSRPH